MLEHATPRALAGVLEVFPATITYSRAVGTEPQPALAVSASPAVMAAIAETIERLDRPSKPARGVELTAYIVEAVSDSDDIDVPPLLEPVVAQLRETLRYQGYRVIDSLIARTTEGSDAAIKGVTRSSPPRPSFSYTMVERGIAVTSRSDGSKSVRVEQLRFTASTRQFGPPDPTSGGDFQAEINASIDIGEGQQVVVGKAGMGDSGNALILVLSARVTD